MGKGYKLMNTAARMYENHIKGTTGPKPKGGEHQPSEDATGEGSFDNPGFKPGSKKGGSPKASSTAAGEYKEDAQIGTGSFKKPGGHPNPHGGYSEGAQEAISSKMHKMKGEDKPQKQKVAIAMSEARQKGYKVPNK